MNINIDPRFNVLLENDEDNSFAIEVAEVIQDMLESEEVSAGEKGRWFNLKEDMLKAVELSKSLEHDWIESELEFWGLNY
jgi:hypothetical protein